MGINVDTTISLTFLLGGMLAGAAGLIYALYQTTIWFFQGFTGGLIAFTAAVMGGIGNLRGAVARRPDHRLHPADVGQPHRLRVDAGGRVRLSDPDHGLQAVGPARRADEGRRMSVAASEAPQPAPSPEEKGLRAARLGREARHPAVVLVIAIVAPVLHRQRGRSCSSAPSPLAYVVMALGLNIVVGFAGLLDLGYVAFFAIGAFSRRLVRLRALRLRQQRGGHPHPRRRQRGQPAGHPHELPAS